MKEISVEWDGIRPLVMANPQTIRLSNSFAIEARKLNSNLKKARKKEDESVMMELEQQQFWNDFCSSAYWSEEQKRFYLPDSVLLACIRTGASAAKKGKDIDRAVLITETEVLIQTKPVKSLEEAFQDPSFRLGGPCRIPPKTGALIWKMRCMIPTGWKMVFHIVFDEQVFPGKSIEKVLEAAGEAGIGGWRPRFGRFLVKIIQ